MSEFNRKEEGKGGFLPFLSRFFGGGSSAAGRVSGLGGGTGAGGGFGGLFATKAGVLGVLLGGATIAAGVGVIYNFIGPSSKPVYNPQLFQETYYEEQAKNAGRARAKERAEAAAPASTLEMFREQARRDGLGMDGAGSSGAEGDSLAEPSSGDPAAAAAGAPGGGDAAAGAPSGSGARLASAGFGKGAAGAGGAGAGSNTLRIGGGAPGGPGTLASSVYRPPAGQGLGASSGMKKSLAAAVRNSPKYTVPNFNKKGAFGQAKFAGLAGNQAAYSASGTGARSSAAEAFSGATSGGGDVAVPGGGVGIGGSGISAGANLKANDPSLNTNNSQPPKVGEPENVSPWKKMTDMAMYAMLAAAVLVFITNMLAKRAKEALAKAQAAAGTPAAPVLFAAAAAAYSAAKMAAYAAMAASALVIVAGVMLMSKFGQKWSGIMYMAAGGMLMYKAYQALSGMAEGSAAANEGAAVQAATGSAAGQGVEAAAARTIGVGDAAVAQPVSDPGAGIVATPLDNPPAAPEADVHDGGN